MRGSSSSVPSVITVMCAALSRLMKSCDPHRAQNSFSRFADDLYTDRCANPSMCKSEVRTSALVEKADP